MALYSHNSMQCKATRQSACLALSSQENGRKAAFLLSRFPSGTQQKLATRMKLLFDFLPILLFF
ncbi:MAG: hypothetical protein KDJ28_14485, partial [Candidatus Competibacteraceae bacterium]|nr:hypothetical protein [Candidatus Competibacteraceae bacterium]